MKPEGRVALVTGAASGIGRATALALAERGAQLVLCDVDEPGLQRVAAEVETLSECLLATPVDVSDRDAMRDFADAVHGRVAAVDILVNNAGVGLAGGLLDSSLEDLDWVLSINLWGVIHGCHLFVPPMVEVGAGHVVNVSSMLGYVGLADTLGYSTSKFGVFGFSESLRAELAPHGVQVSTICPGMVRTNIVRTSRFAGRVQDEALRARVDDAYVKRNYGPEKVARAIVGAVEKGRGVVPVTPEAWAAWLLTRFTPGLAARLGRTLNRHFVD